MRFTADVVMYAAIAAIPVALAWDKPLDWRFTLTVALAATTAAKAKLSPSKKEVANES